MSTQEGPGLYPSQYETFRCSSGFYLTSWLRGAHQRTHQLAQSRLWLIMMGLMVVVPSRSKSRQKVEKLSKVEKPQRPKKLQRLSVRRNVYQSTNPPSIGYEELELPLELWQFFKLFCWAQKLSQYHVRSDYYHGKANGAADALSRFSPIEGRSSSWILESFTSCDQRPSATSFCLQDARPPFAQFWRRTPEEDVSVQDQSGDAWWLKRYQESCASGPVLRSWNHPNWAD